MPRSLIVFSVEKTRSTTVGARPSDGSSRSRIDGLATSARAIASCCCWPPDRAPACRCAKLLDDREQLGDVGDVRVDAVRARASREPEPEVLVHRELCEEASPLGDECDTGSRDGLGRASAERPVAEADLASASGHEPHDRVQRRRLPGAVRSDEPDELAGRDGEREAADGSDAAVGDLEVTELEGAAH